MRTLKLVCLLVVALLAAPLAMAQQMYVDVTNRTGFTILMLHVSPSNSDDWEEDVLGADTIDSGQTQRITLSGYSTPYFDIKAVDSDGDTYIRTNVDVTVSDVVFSLEDLVR